MTVIYARDIIGKRRRRRSARRERWMSGTMVVCRFVVVLSIILSGISAARGDMSSIATSDVDGRPMSLLPDSFSNAPSEPGTVYAPAPSVRPRTDRKKLMSDEERDQTAAQLRALAAQNAAKAGGRSSDFSSRLRRLGKSHGSDALKKIEND